MSLLQLFAFALGVWAIFWGLAVLARHGSFAWYDMWVGIYYDRKARRVYFCCFGLLMWLDIEE